MMSKAAGRTKSKGLRSLTVIGAGRMGSALIRGVLDAGLLGPKQVIAGDPSEAARDQLKRQCGVRTTGKNAEAVRDADVILLAVKPDRVRPVLQELRHSLRPGQLLLSIAAGVSLKALEANLPRGTRVIRAMPNTPSLVSEGATVFSRGKYARPADAAQVALLFGSVGVTLELDEKHLDAVTALSASGPAYVFLIIEALSDGGVKMGLPRKVAARLAAQTVLGAAKMALETGRHPGELKDQVTSPGGTTIAGLHVLEDRGLRGILMEAVEAATRRARELGKE